MKILLIANARTGSTVLYKALSDILGLKKYGEPFNYGMRRKANSLIRKYPFPLEDNCIVKTLTRHIPEEFESQEINFYDELDVSETFYEQESEYEK